MTSLIRLFVLHLNIELHALFLSFAFNGIWTWFFNITSLLSTVQLHCREGSHSTELDFHFYGYLHTMGCPIVSFCCTSRLVQTTWDGYLLPASDRANPRDHSSITNSKYFDGELFLYNHSLCSAKVRRIPFVCKGWDNHKKHVLGHSVLFQDWGCTEVEVTLAAHLTWGQWLNADGIS